ncbi:MAG: hypothetical protein JWM85_3597 [Acidimicrobiaceae bacterium]|nr:hypothetical protein [Acidimicrobiaceae bacterium]
MKNYQTASAGAAATAAEMQAITPTVVGALQSNTPWTSWTTTQSTQISKWGTHAFANLISGKNPPQPAGTGSNAPAPVSSSGTACINSLAEYSTANPNPIPGSQFLGWFFQPCIMKRAGLILLGTGLIIFGLKQLGAKGPANAVQEAGHKVFVGSGTRAPNLTPKFTSDQKPEAPAPKPVAEAPSEPPPALPPVSRSRPSRPRKPREIGKVLA